ncbi:MAG: bacteriohemerythrin [Clostridiales bacterium]|nr:bacteriohemerythrin [Clostridiales bacterium]
MFIEFDDDLVLGDNMIDSQHRELFDKINNLLASCEKNGGKVAAAQTLGYLADYTEFHFNAEEKLQQDIGYPGFAEHKQRHDELRQVVKDLEEMLADQEGPTDEFVHQVKVNVADWLIYHIKGFDRSVAEYRFMLDNPGRI